MIDLEQMDARSRDNHAAGVEETLRDELRRYGNIILRGKEAEVAINAIRNAAAPLPEEVERVIAELQRRTRFCRQMDEGKLPPGPYTAEANRNEEAAALITQQAQALADANARIRAMEEALAWQSDPKERISRDRDIILEAINTYDEWMLDDAYDADTILRNIIDRMRDRASRGGNNAD